MATQEKNLKVPLINADSANQIKEYLCKIMDYTKSDDSIRTKMDYIDKAYARYLTAKETKDLVGIQRYGNQQVGVADKAITSPIVISQVQSMVAYFSEVYLSGYPIFPVVATPDLRTEAEALEGIIQDHLVMSESVPELQLMFNDAAKYNRVAWEVDWKPITTYSPQTELTELEAGKATLKKDYKHINAIKRLNLRNFHYDETVPFAKVATKGNYAGYSEIISRVGLKDHLNYLSSEKKLVSNDVVKKALESSFDSTDFHEDPIISSDLTSSTNRGVDWDLFGGFVPPGNHQRRVPSNSSGIYLISKFYLRLIPSDFNLNTPNKNSVQVFVVEMVNREVVISMEPYYGAYGALGIGTAYAIEDGLEDQTQGYGEMAIPLQEAASRLYNIRFQSAKRALQDRALFDPKMIRAADINSPIAAPKIPVDTAGMLEGGLDRAYKQIPYDGRGTENVLQDAREITDWQKELSGMNNATRGQFQKGNKTMSEFNTIMGNSENRMRLPALVLEFRMMQRIKNQLKLNILQFGEDTQIVSPRTGLPIEVEITKLQARNLQFEIGDGYTPKSKLAASETLSAGMQLIGQSASLQQAYGMQLPAMFAHLMTSGGVRGFDQYTVAATAEWEKSLTLQGQVAQLQQQMMQMMQQQQGGQPQAQGAGNESQPQ